MDDRCPICGGYRALPRMLYDDDIPRECSDAFHKEPAPEIVHSEAESNVVEMRPQESTQPESNPRLLPICPYCGQEGRLSGRMTSFGPVNIMVVRCANDNCRKILGMFQPLGMEPVGFAPPTGPSN